MSRRRRDSLDEPGGDPVDDASTQVMGTLTTYTRLVANEPSVGMYFVQEHVRKSVPFVVATKNRVNDAAKQAQLCKLDVDAGLQTIGVMRDIGSPTLRNMNQSIASASRSLSKLKIKRGLS